MGSQGYTDRDPSSGAGLEENSGSPWAWVLSAYALVLVSLVLLHALGTDGKYFIRSLVCIAPATALSLVGVCILIQQYWRLARRESKFADAVQVAVFLAFPIIIVTFEAFAGLTALLWSRGLLFSTSALDPSLWTVEKFYAWHMAKAIPVLEVTKTLGWRVPTMFTGHLSGVLLLAFKIILLLPILGILTAIYEKYRDRHANQLKGISESDRYQSESVIIMLPRYIISWILLAALPLIGYLIIRFFVSDSSPVNRWLISKDIASWAPTAMHIIGIIIIVAIAMRIIIEPSTRIISVMGFNVLTSITVVMRRVRHLVVATLAACAVTVALLPSGVTHTAPALEHGDDIAATADWYFWHLAEIIPFVAVPQSLNWSLKFEFVDTWSRVLLLMLKIYLVVIIFLTVVLIFDLYKEVATETSGESGQSRVT